MVIKNDFKKRKESNIVCYVAGDTEEHYLKEYSKKRNIPFRVHRKSEATNIFQKAVEDIISDKRLTIFAFCDYDNDVAKKIANSLKEKSKQNHNLIVIVFKPEVEIWFLMHLQDISKENGFGSSKLKQIFEPIWKKNFSEPYKKGDEKIYDKLEKHMEYALQQAEKDTKRKFVENILEFFDKIDTLKKSTNS
jgi:hypothetical protein